MDGLSPEAILGNNASETGSDIPATPQWLFAEHGSFDQWNPPRNCSRASGEDLWCEIGCNADGVVWARMIANGIGFFSTQQSKVTKIAARPSQGIPGLVVGGEFQGFTIQSGGFQVIVLRALHVYVYVYAYIIMAQDLMWPDRLNVCSD